jgi:hypothetical protein
MSVLPQVFQQPTAAAVEHLQATTAVVVQLVCLEMVGDIGDSTGQQCDLNLRRNHGCGSPGGDAGPSALFTPPDSSSTPDLHDGVDTAGGQHLAVRAKRHCHETQIAG